MTTTDKKIDIIPNVAWIWERGFDRGSDLYVKPPEAVAIVMRAYVRAFPFDISLVSRDAWMTATTESVRVEREMVAKIEASWSNKPTKAEDLFLKIPLGDTRSPQRAWVDKELTKLLENFKPAAPEPTSVPAEPSPIAELRAEIADLRTRIEALERR